MRQRCAQGRERISPVTAALPHDGLLWCGAALAVDWLTDGLLLVDATAAAIAAAEDRAGGCPAALAASRDRLNTDEGPAPWGAAPGLGKTMSAAAENAAAVRNLLNDAAVVESVSGEPADTGANPAAGDMMVGTLYTVESGNEPPAAPRLLSVLAYQELVLW